MASCTGRGIGRASGTKVQCEPSAPVKNAIPESRTFPPPCGRSPPPVAATSSSGRVIGVFQRARLREPNSGVASQRTQEVVVNSGPGMIVTAPRVTGLACPWSDAGRSRARRARRRIASRSG